MFERHITAKLSRFAERADRVRDAARAIRPGRNGAPVDAVPLVEAPCGDRVAVRSPNGHLRVRADVLAAISATVGALPAESGGFLGITDGVIDSYRFDQRSATTGATYAPDVVAANDERRAWERRGGRFGGFVHSHPGSFARPSLPDREYAQRILATAKVSELLLPIVLPKRGGAASTIEWFVAQTGSDGVARVERVDVDVVRAPLPAQFERVAGAYDVAWLSRCRVVAVGCGGAREALENLARIGVGQFVLVDRDVVSAENLGTQAVRRNEIGRPKVLAVADAIHEINPDASVVALHSAIQDVPREQLPTLIDGRWAECESPARTVVGMWSDSPAANAYAHRFALHFGVPAVSASLHLGGVSGEVALSYPGRTTACIRCATSSRYEHYLAGGANDATSAGVPLWATPRLNALKLCVIAAALHATDEHRFATSPERRRQNELLDRIVQHPLALLRLAPDAAAVSGLRIHEHVFEGCTHPDRVVFDETVWREIEPRHRCPDCGGRGDLRLAQGRLSDFDALPELEQIA